MKQLDQDAYEGTFSELDTKSISLAVKRVNSQLPLALGGTEEIIKIHILDRWIPNS